MLIVTSLGVALLSWSMEIRGDEYASSAMLSALWEAQLRHEDGSLTALDLAPAFTYTHADGEVYTMTVWQWFVKLIDVSDVTAVILNEVEFSLE